MDEEAKKQIAELEKKLRELEAQVSRGCLIGKCVYGNRFMCGWMVQECGEHNGWRFFKRYDTAAANEMEAMDNRLLKEAINLLKMVTPINEFALESGMYDDIANHPEYNEREIGAYRQLTHSEQFKVIQFIRKVENILGAAAAK